MQQPPQPTGGRALRLTFRYEDSRIELVARQQVDMLVPPSHPVDEGQGRSGFWFTVRAADGQPLYRRVMQSPIRTEAEVFSPAATENIHRVAVTRPQGTFVLLVPDLPAGQFLTLHMAPTQAAAQLQAAQEIARFDLRERRS
jgi:hypothetical protein